jgi:DNA-binding MarR family transcriptional regulator
MAAPETPPVDPLQLAEALQRAAKCLRKETFHRLVPYGITPAQGRALDTLGRAADVHGREMRLNELAERLRIAPRSATTVVDALEAAGLVGRVPDPADRRATLLRLTPEGRAAVEQIGAVRREVAEEHFGPVPEPDRATALRVLREVTEAGRPCAGAGAPGHGEAERPAGGTLPCPG